MGTLLGCLGVIPVHRYSIEQRRDYVIQANKELDASEEEWKADYRRRAEEHKLGKPIEVRVQDEHEPSSDSVDVLDGKQALNRTTSSNESKTSAESKVSAESRLSANSLNALFGDVPS